MKIKWLGYWMLCLYLIIGAVVIAVAKPDSEAYRKRITRLTEAAKDQRAYELVTLSMELKTQDLSFADWFETQHVEGKPVPSFFMKPNCALDDYNLAIYVMYMYRTWEKLRPIVPPVRYDAE